jgi:hypothetical protein
MRIIEKTRDSFVGTHKGATIRVNRESNGRFYIIVHDEAGLYLCDGFADESVLTMADAKREAIRCACL